MAARCGSYPYLNIAEDFGVPYDVVLSYSDGAKSGLTRDERGCLRFGAVTYRLSYWQERAMDYVLANLSMETLYRFDDRIGTAVMREMQGDRNG